MAFFIQSDYGFVGNFEVVTDSPNDGYQGLLHRWRNNEATGFPWHFDRHIARRRFVCRKPALIQHQPSHQLHVVALVTEGVATTLRHFIRLNNPTWAWQDPETLPGSERHEYSGGPVLVQDGPFLEVYAPLRSGGFARWQRGATNWIEIGVFARDLGVIHAMELVVSSLGRFELVIRRGTQLSHISRESAGDDFGWSGPRMLFDGAAGTPGFIQSRFGLHGNYEIITPTGGGTLAGLWCDNDDPMRPRWSAPYPVAVRYGDPGDPVTDNDAVGLIQSRFGWIGHLEVIARRNGRSDFFWRIDGPPWTWYGPQRIAVDPPDAGAALRRTDTLERRLAGCADLRNAIIWETGAAEKRVYDDWTRAQKDRLNELFQGLRMDVADLGIRCPDPAMSIALRPDHSRRLPIFFTAEQAFDIYAAHVAHAFHLEATGAVRWSLLDLPALELAELLSSDRYYARIVPWSTLMDPATFYPPHIRVGRDFQGPARMIGGGTGFSCDPRTGYRFIRGTRTLLRQDQLAASEEEMLGNLLLWFFRNLAHGRPIEDGMRSTLVRRSLLQDLLRLETREYDGDRLTRVWAGFGCHDAANLLHALARSVNIPLLVHATVEPVRNAHLGVTFRFQRSGTRVLQHLDDAYAIGLAPFFPVRADGAVVPASELAMFVFRAMFTPIDVIERDGYINPPWYNLFEVQSHDLPNSGPLPGEWPTREALDLHIREKRYQLASWEDFIQPNCYGFLTEDELMMAGTPWPRPVAELQRRAQASVDAYERGNCEGMEERVRQWHARGADGWMDR